uniref:Olfactory receptor n=1 Tax=Podarcis muralis TaxID=64176 RepID=A0A670ICH7_PODMU
MSSIPEYNDSVVSHQTFVLIGIPGMQEKNSWVAFPLFVLYALTLLGNIMILYVIKIDPSLHEPMYFFLCLLACSDLGLCISTMPTMLGVYWFDSREIPLNGCISQLFFIHIFQEMDSGILVSMAYDRFIAIRDPLRYRIRLPNSVIAKIAIAIFCRSFCVIFPCPFLIKRLPFCRSNVLSHSYCLHPDAMTLACSGTKVNILYGLVMAMFTLGLDVVIILISYVLILKTVLSIASHQERLKALNTCISHISAILIFYLACADTRVNIFYGLIIAVSTLGTDIVIILASYVMILKTVLSIASHEECFKALNTCVAHISAILIFYVPMIGIAVVHRYGKHLSPIVHMLMANTFVMVPPLLNPVVYCVKTQRIRQRVWNILHFKKKLGLIFLPK